MYIFIDYLPVWAGVKICSSPNREWNQNRFQPKQEMELWTMEVYTNCNIDLSVDI